MFALEGKLTEPQYRVLITQSLKYCAFAVVMDLDRSSYRGIAGFFDEMKPYRQASMEINEWPGSKLSKGRTALGHRFELCQESIKVILHHSHDLFDWDGANLPLDLNLIRADRSVWLTTTACEEYAGFIPRGSGADRINSGFTMAFAEKVGMARRWSGLSNSFLDLAPCTAFYLTEFELSSKIQC